MNEYGPFPQVYGRLKCVLRIERRFFHLKTLGYFEPLKVFFFKSAENFQMNLVCIWRSFLGDDGFRAERLSFISNL